MMRLRLLAWGKDTVKVIPSHCIVLGDTCYQHNLLLVILTLITGVRGCLPVELGFLLFGVFFVFCRAVVFLFLYSLLWKQVTQPSPSSRGEELSSVSETTDPTHILL